MQKLQGAISHCNVPPPLSPKKGSEVQRYLWKPAQYFWGSSVTLRVMVVTLRSYVCGDALRALRYGVTRYGGVTVAKDPRAAERQKRYRDRLKGGGGEVVVLNADSVPGRLQALEVAVALLKAYEPRLKAVEDQVAALRDRFQAQAGVEPARRFGPVVTRRWRSRIRVSVRRWMGHERK
jgi:hypothetical protein